LRLGREVTRAVAALGAGGRVGRDDLALPMRTLGDVAVRVRDVDELLARLDGLGHRARIALDEVAVGRGRLHGLAAFLVQLRGAPERLALDRDVAVRVRNALELARGERAVARFYVSDGELRVDVGRELVVRKVAAEVLEHGRRLRPVVRLDQRRGRVV